MMDGRSETNISPEQLCISRVCHSITIKTINLRQHGMLMLPNIAHMSDG